MPILQNGSDYWKAIQGRRHQSLAAEGGERKVRKDEGLREAVIRGEDCPDQDIRETVFQGGTEEENQRDSSVV